MKEPQAGAEAACHRPQSLLCQGKEQGLYSSSFSPWCGALSPSRRPGRRPRRAGWALCFPHTWTTILGGGKPGRGQWQEARPENGPGFAISLPSLSSRPFGYFTGEGDYTQGRPACQSQPGPARLGCAKPQLCGRGCIESRNISARALCQAAHLLLFCCLGPSRPSWECPQME